jgi:NADPH-dependent curcumin reductase CurA
MTDQPQRHRRWVLASRPHGEPTAENFRLEESEVPTRAGAGAAAYRLFIADPYMRGRMSDAPSYSPPVAIGAVMVEGP